MAQVTLTGILCIIFVFFFLYSSFVFCYTWGCSHVPWLTVTVGHTVRASLPRRFTRINQLGGGNDQRGSKGRMQG